ncbi:MAG: LysR family transcriptional regulator [Gluconobacter albidus]
MPDLALDLRYLKYVVLAAECGSFRKTAHALNLSQSTISRRVELLERRLGISLFERSKSGIRLTRTGEHFLGAAKSGAEQLHDAIRGMSLFRQGLSGELRLGIMTSLASGFLPETLSRFRSCYPDIAVKLEENSSQLNIAGILSGRLDAAFVQGTFEVPGCNVRTFWEERVFAALPASHACGQHAAIRWSDIQGETFLVSSDGSGPDVERYIIQHMSALGVRPKLLPQKVGRENILNLVSSGFGVALATEAAAGMPYNGVRFVPIAESEKCRWSLVLPQSNTNPALRSFATLCAQMSIVRP